MRHRNKHVGAGFLLVVATIGLAACSSPGDLHIVNDSASDVTIFGDDEVATVSANGAVSILGLGCSKGDVRVEFDSGEKFVAVGPICPEDQIVVLNDKVEVRPFTEDAP